MTRTTRKALQPGAFSPLAFRFGLFLILALAASSAFAQCKQWDVSGAWVINQEDYITVYINLRQKGTQLVGSADYTLENIAARVQPMVLGAVHGEINGNRFAVKIHWTEPRPQIADYTAQVDANGRFINGHASVGARRGVAWTSANVMKCADRQSTR
jgi:hypothetical protein